MSISAKIEPLDRDFLLTFTSDMSPESRSAALAEFAAEGIAEAVAANTQSSSGIAPAYRQFVDGREGAALASVKPDGTIVAEFDLHGDVVDWIWQEVLAASPQRTGRYMKSHRLFADGEEMMAPDPSKVATEWVITTTVPYARKLEGMNGRQPLSQQAPEGIYQAVIALARRRFGNIAAIRFSARSVEGAELSAWADKTKLRSKGHATAHRRRDWLTRQPAIVITFR